MAPHGGNPTQLVLHLHMKMASQHIRNRSMAPNSMCVFHTLSIVRLSILQGIWTVRIEQYSQHMNGKSLRHISKVIPILIERCMTILLRCSRSSPKLSPSGTCEHIFNVVLISPPIEQDFRTEGWRPKNCVTGIERTVLRAGNPSRGC